MIHAILTDIEGTTSSLSFVRDVLFPYSAQKLPGFARERRDAPEVKRLLADARAYAGGNPDDEALVARMLAWIEADQKITPLKALQGLVWTDGYVRGDFQGHVYEDAARRLREWHDAGLRLYAWSSDSAHAQRLLFAHTVFGDLTSLFDGHFDTRIGGKRDTAAYKAIAEEIGLPTDEILYLSDSAGELDAAREAGMRTIALQRKGDTGGFGDHPVVADFDAARPEAI